MRTVAYHDGEDLDYGEVDDLSEQEAGQCCVKGRPAQRPRAETITEANDLPSCSKWRALYPCLES
jgi:hypothetical protein